MEKFEAAKEQEKIINILKSGGIGVLPTDTLYGIVGSALNETAVEKIYALRERELNKPLIVLIADIDDLKIFHINLTEERKKFLMRFWPGKISIILPCDNQEFAYLHRGTRTIAFRMPADEDLLKLLKKAGPIVAPSANLSGEQPAATIEEAKKYFAENVDFYLNAGPLISEPSTVAKLENDGNLTILRRGAVKL